MIKLFRHIRLRLLTQASSDKVRQTMIKENPNSADMSTEVNTKEEAKAGKRVSKYMLYAIGEIILVVAGILIALQLNNWNTEQKRTEQELGLLIEMRENLLNDLDDVEYNINSNKRLLFGCEMVMRHLTERTPFHDSLKVHYAQIFGNTKQTNNSSAFENLKSSGFDLIQNDSLRRRISTLYTEQLPILDVQESSFDAGIQMQNLSNLIYGKVIVDAVWQSAYPLDASSLMDDEVFKGALRMNIFARIFMLDRYQKLKIRIEGLIEQISTELEERQK